MLELVAVDFVKSGTEPVDIVIDGRTLTRLNVLSGSTQTFTVVVTDALLQPGKPLDVELKYPEAIRVGADDPNTRKRSIKLMAGAGRARAIRRCSKLERQETKGLT